PHLPPALPPWFPRQRLSRPRKPAEPRLASLPLRSSSQRLLMVVTENWDPQRSPRPHVPPSARSETSRFIPAVLHFCYVSLCWSLGDLIRIRSARLIQDRPRCRFIPALCQNIFDPAWVIQNESS